MTIMETIQSISGWGWGGIIILILSLIQIAPIKLDPWTWIATNLGRALNKEVLEKQDHMQLESQEYRKNNDMQIRNLSNKFDKRAAEDARNRILRFGDEIKTKQIKHSEEFYNQVLADITDYEKYCKEHPNFKNERTVATEKIIKEAYAEHVKNDDFL